MSVKRVSTQVSDVVVQMTKIRVSCYFPPQSWRPCINAYRLADALEVCVDLAGVDCELIDLSVREGRLVLRGYRNPPVPEQGQPTQIMAMEIDCGVFERDFPLPPEVDPDQITARQNNGLLWIHLPLRS